MNNKKIKFAGLKNGRGWLAVSGAALTAIGLGNCSTAQAHGFVGDRFFPPTIATDDPFATDELLFPSVSYFKSAGSPAIATTDVGFEFDKEIFPKFALGFAGDYLYQKPDGQPSASGWDNFSLSAKYQLWENVPHEAIFSAGMEWDMGGTGSKQVGADSANTFTPTIYFGKGFGDLPDSLNYAKPFALAGTLGEDLPTSANPNNLQWGLALEYNLPYLQSEVKNIGLPAPFKHMIPLVEFAFTTPENRGGGPTTGTINPGILYENNYFQLGAEAIIPANSDTGSQVGAIVQLQIYIDDIWPKLFGYPVFGK
ncbi:MAG TPA: hypothetical protein VMA13_05885 [Candidatus Saccharimonadales bacterium]|nr:hypothetical protein [Candidatus Saccharimonadales bacterium]